MSQQERVSWVSVVVNVVIGCWYFSYVLGLPGSTNLLGMGMVGFVAAITFAAILTAIVSNVVLREVQKHGGVDPARRERLDERDRLISLRAGRNGYVVLTAMTAFVVGMIGMTQWLGSWQVHFTFSHDTVLTRLIAGPLTGGLIVQWLLLAMTLAEVCKYLTQIVSYRRGY